MKIVSIEEAALLHKMGVPVRFRKPDWDEWAYLLDSSIPPGEHEDDAEGLFLWAIESAPQENQNDTNHHEIGKGALT